MFASLMSKKSGRSTSPTATPFANPPYGTFDSHRISTGDDAGDEDESGSDHDLEGDHLLPIFSAEVLDNIPIYNHTHSIRILVIQRCETTLSWDQLRSPQVSQFLVKPVQQLIRSSHFSRGTLYALIANSLQFHKEGQNNPGNIGVLRTRAMICELLAMRLLKEFSTRELVDALSYDFNPMQGITLPMSVGARGASRAARMSTVEIAIRAQAKKFLAHPLVVQQLEAIWAGTIVFHSSADELHRRTDGRRSPPTRNHSSVNLLSMLSQSAKGKGKAPTREGSHTATPAEPVHRRSVTLYNPRNASMFKLSRLRVPRYRHLFSTLSFAVMLGLFLATLSRKSLDITGLEILFWFWSAGYMLDEIVGFTEQGFGLYIMSVWNAFDLGILLLFVAYYVLRLYGIIMPDVQKKNIANSAYDVLACTAVLLFPRLFSVLDHYRYFSQLLIAFRLMALDLVALLCLIVVSCSGFFVAFTFAFSNDDFDAPSVAYALFQILMGFTPAAWEIWPDLPPLGKTILTLFLFICHFLIVTILITVLTNSFMAVVQNADTEHSYLLAVNTISMVKSDALFSYVAPTNIIGWLLIPLQYVMPFPKFIRMNRYIIKITHIPILFAIFLYERVVMSRLAYEPADLVENRGRNPSRAPAFTARGEEVFSPGARLREPSVTTFQKDRALEEVFRRPFRDGPKQYDESTILGRRKNSTAVRAWMQRMGSDGGASPPMEQPRTVLERLEHRRPRFRKAETMQFISTRRRSLPSNIRDTTSDPEELTPKMRATRPQPIDEEDEEAEELESIRTSIDEMRQQQTDADGDDELVTNDEDDHATSDHDDSDKENRILRTRSPSQADSDDDDAFFRTPMTARQISPVLPGSFSPTKGNAFHLEATSKSAKRPQIAHSRNISTNTVLFNPNQMAFPPLKSASPPKRHSNGLRSGTATPGGTRRAPKAQRPPTAGFASSVSSLSRPVRSRHQSNSNVLDLLHGQNRSLTAAALDLASDLGDNRYGPDPIASAAYPASFTTQLEMATRRRAQEESENSNMVGKLVLARMQTLEENFREILGELRGIRDDERERKGTNSTAPGSSKSVPTRKAKGRSNNSTGPSTGVSSAVGSVKGEERQKLAGVPSSP